MIARRLLADGRTDIYWDKSGRQGGQCTRSYRGEWPAKAGNECRVRLPEWTVAGPIERWALCWAECQQLTSTSTTTVLNDSRTGRDYRVVAGQRSLVTFVSSFRYFSVIVVADDWQGNAGIQITQRLIGGFAPQASTMHRCEISVEESTVVTGQSMRPQNSKFYNIWECKRPKGAYPLRDYYGIFRTRRQFSEGFIYFI